MEELASSLRFAGTTKDRFADEVIEDPARVWSEIGQIQDPSRRGMLGELFFEILAGHDLRAAIEFLPEAGDANFQDRVLWIGTVAEVGVKSGKPDQAEQVLGLLNDRFPGGGASAVLMRIVGPLGNSGYTSHFVRSFWERVRPGAGKDSQAGTFASYLAALDPIEAIRWYTNLERREEQEYAIRSLASQNPELILQQFGATEDPTVRQVLVEELGDRIAATGGDFKRYFAQVPEEFLSELEVAYVRGMVSEEGSRQPSIDRVEAYLEEAVTQKAKDQIEVMLASRAFVESPTAALDQIQANGVAGRNPAAWQALTRRWLYVDSLAAGEYISNLPDGPLSNEAVEVMIDYLNDAGQLEEANSWQEHLESRRNANAVPRPSED